MHDFRCQNIANGQNLAYFGAGDAIIMNSGANRHIATASGGDCAGHSRCRVGFTVSRDLQTAYCCLRRRQGNRAKMLIASPQKDHEIRTKAKKRGCDFKASLRARKCDARWRFFGTDHVFFFAGAFVPLALAITSR